MLKIVVACANGAGSSLMIKFKVEKIMKDLGVAATVHHCAIAEAKSIVPQYDVVVTALNFVKMFDFAKDKVHVIGVKNVLSEQEIKEKILESGVCGQ
ncbi:MAG TPA: PTS sugar transporter subunit IIB [Hydrogenispora sp.]|jgi:PTS system ascorbate-specific IIB component|nr:PTS sugar transporter subunit IIB [Hydrogenispora sp.]